MSPFIKRLQDVEPDLAPEIERAARNAIFSHLVQMVPWYRAIHKTTLFKVIGIQDMLDQFAGEMYLAMQAGASQEDAFAQACKLCLKHWRQYDHKQEKEWSYEATVEHVGAGDTSANMLEPADVHPELSHEDEYPSVTQHSEWGPKHVLADKLLTLMTDKQREAVELYAGRHESVATVGETLGIERRSAWNRMHHARKKAIKAIREGQIETDLIQV